GVWGDVLREQKTDESKYRFGYQGQFAERDEETGWNHFELREYDPVIGRWSAVDPLREFYSPYLGMGNNPISTFDPNGGDVIVLSAPQGAGGHGHAALLVGNDNTGWTYISKDGTSWWPGAIGPANQSTIDANNAPVFCTLQEFLNSPYNVDAENANNSEYHFGLQFITDENTDREIIGMAKEGSMELYNVLIANCVQNCLDPLVESGVLPEKFKHGRVRPTEAFISLINFMKNFNHQDENYQNNFGQNFHLRRETGPRGYFEIDPPILVGTE
ncbi:MAG TPA: RHS repeat-associated core domain-containing protein, partial [Saprospiraceae bacterium]